VIRRAALAIGAAAFSLAGGAHAELREDAARVAEQWKNAGGAVSVVPPRFLSEDETVSVLLPRGEGECINVALVGARGMSFHARVSGAEDEPEDQATRASSVAGALSITRCGGSLVRRLVLVSDAGRGALETVVAFSKAPLAPVRVALPERTGGALPTAPDPGELPALPPPEKRADVAEVRARRDGGAVQPRGHWQAASDGTGNAKISLAAGCHRIELFAPEGRGARASRRGRLDVDAELRDEVDDRVLARDRSDAADAHLDACVGEETRATIVFAGAPPDAQVLATHLAWPIPERVPSTWGPDARARMAHVMLARHVAPPRGDAVMQAMGGAQVTPVPIAIEPGACYLAVVAVVQGQSKGIGLRAMVGARETTDDRGTADSAGAVAFCAGDRRRALLEVDARGTGMAWGLALFRVQSGAWEMAR
jgi:hypothetical protein